MKAFNTKEELKAYSKENHYKINATTEEIVAFIKANKGKYLYLRGANLRGANLSGLDLAGANLRYANFAEFLVFLLEYYSNNESISYTILLPPPTNQTFYGH